MKVAYLGPKNTFTEMITRKIYPKAKLIPIQPIRRVIMAVENKKVDRAVVPIENFYNGEVRQTLDTLTECKETKIIVETSMEIVLCLGALPNHKRIKKILSKDQALEQAGRFLSDKYPEVLTMVTPSTTRAAEIIKESNITSGAAIASEKALKENNLEILEKDICPNNKTRFIVLSRERTKPTGDDKTFLVIHPQLDKPGILYHTIGFLAGLGINLEYIQSRPDGKKGYYFYVELDGHALDENIRKALSAIRLSLDPQKKHPDTIKILGSYKNTQWKGN